MLSSSSSDSGSGCGGVGAFWGAATGALEDSAGGGATDAAGAEAASCFGFSIVGGMSVVECLPVVQGSILRNSSKVRTLGLQHFQPSQS